MRYAILSDVHDRCHKLEAVLADAQWRNVGQIVSLGDVGGGDCLNLLLQARALVVFGNYEVSGWRHLSPRYRSWVRRWPPFLAKDGFLAVHAVPWWPAGLRNVQDFGAWLQLSGRSWRMLFPYLNEDHDHLWQALAQLETAGKSLLFHGHTHLQSIWHWRPSGKLQAIRDSSFYVESEHRYLVGVGSVGLPEDGGWSAYTLYDDATRHVEQIHLTSR